MDAVSGDVAFALGALLMAADLIVKLGPLYPSLARRLPISESYSEPAAEPMPALVIQRDS